MKKMLKQIFLLLFLLKKYPWSQIRIRIHFECGIRFRVRIHFEILCPDPYPTLFICKYRYWIRIRKNDYGSETLTELHD